MSARTELLDRLKYLNSAISMPSMIDNGIMSSEHNGVANLLRKGLGIVAFNILEDFIKGRCLESLTHLSESGISFSRLTLDLQEAAISGALSALSFRSKIEKKDGGDWKSLIQDEALKIHSTKNSPFVISKYTLVSSGSNISAEEIPGVLKSFGIIGGWGKMKMVSDSIGGGIPDLSQSYKNAAERRHNAAHTASFQYNYQWLENIKSEIIAISASFDILLAARCRQVTSDPRKDLTAHDIEGALKFRFIECTGKSYRETTVIGGKARKVWSSLDDAIDSLKPGLRGRNEFLTILNSSRRIEAWHY